MIFHWKLETEEYRMKKKYLILLGAIFALVWAVAPAFAVDESYYGDWVQITTKYDYDTYNSDYNYDNLAEYYLSRGKINPVFSPDGKTLAFNGDVGYGVWSAPVEGGTPTLVYNNCHKQDGYVLDGENFGGGMMTTLCFTPDGKEITFLDYILDSARGSRIEVTISGMTIWHPIPVIRSVNIATGLVRTVKEEASDGCWSPDSRYFVYSWYGVGDEWGKNIGLSVLDTQTGESKLLSVGGYSPCITPDGKTVIFSTQSSQTTGSYQSYGLAFNLYQVSITGGEPKRITSYTNSMECCNPRDPAVSPDGEWLLFTGSFKEEANKWLDGLCVYNLKSGESFKAFPRAEFAMTRAKWSPDGKNIVYTVAGKRIYMITFQPTPFWKPTAVNEQAPSEFSLQGNYPNPFNPSTTIEFSLPASGPVNLSVFAITGQKVRELVNGQLEAGKHSLSWDGRDVTGKAVSSGVYISRLSMGNRVISKSMTLAK